MRGTCGQAEGGMAEKKETVEFRKRRTQTPWKDMSERRGRRVRRVCRVCDVVRIIIREGFSFQVLKLR